MRRRFHGTSGFILVCAIVLAGRASGQSITPDSSVPIVFPQTLRAFSQIPLSTAPFGYMGFAPCDDSGKMFFAAAPGGAIGGVTYVSISADGQQQTFNDVPKYITDYPYNTYFAVTPDGRLQLLSVVPYQPVRWLRFDKEGKLAGVVKLPVPGSISVRSFAVTAQDYLLLLGYYQLSRLHGKDDGQTYRAIFDQSGNLVATLATEDSGIQKNGMFAGPVMEPATVEDEQFFWISSSGRSLVVMDTDGNIVRTVRLPGARPGDQVDGLRISGHLALVTYVNFKAKPEEVYLLMNATTGLEYGLYLPPPEVRGSLTCFQSSKGLTFLNPNKGRWSLVESPLP